MKVNYKEGECIDYCIFDFYARKIIAKINVSRDFNVDKVSYRGTVLIAKRIYESFTDYKTIFINGLEFYKLNDHMLRINYLISNGNSLNLKPLNTIYH